MKLIVISNNKPFENEEKILTDLFESGLDTLHLRKPRMSTKGLLNLIDKIPQHFHNRIIIHSHHNLITKFDLKGIHLSKGHLRTLRKTKWKLWLLSFRKPLKNLCLTTSFSQLHSVYEPASFDYKYFFLNPIFDPLSGKLQNGFHEQGLKAANEKSGKKLIARGGVDLSKIERIHQLGFEGFALNSSLWNNSNPLNYFMNVVEECKRLGITIKP
jgi:thiamine-phosphate pyrophosphorylase